ncbi:hypothetical protein VTN02DRAFT_5238 [Thermoascus thermophilus]
MAQDTAEDQRQRVAPTRFTTRDESTSEPDGLEKVTRLLKLRWNRRTLHQGRSRRAFRERSASLIGRDEDGVCGRVWTGRGQAGDWSQTPAPMAAYQHARDPPAIRSALGLPGELAASERERLLGHGLSVSRWARLHRRRTTGALVTAVAAFAAAARACHP